MNYYTYLVDKTGLDDREYSVMLSTLFCIPFEWSHKIPMDANRANDGLAMRSEYELDTNMHADVVGDCNVLEMLVALAIRIDSVMGVPGEDHFDEWFCLMIDNLGLTPEMDPSGIRDVVNRWMRRDIDHNGNGGLFPLEHTSEDQRELSIWDQMTCYINQYY